MTTQRTGTGMTAPGWRLARWALGALTLFAVEEAAAQSPRRTTVDRLLGGPVDTIEVDEYKGGELGGQRAQLRLVRADSGWVGTLRMQVTVSNHGSAPERRCDTAMTASMTSSAARRLFALLRPTVIELGYASDRLPVTDVVWEASDRLTSGSNAVVLRNGSTLMHGETGYRTPPDRDRNGRLRPPSQFLDPNTRLMRAHEMLQRYLQPERLMAFARACRDA